MKLKVVTITAKEKICACEKVSCNPEDCKRAKGHYDRVNDAIYDLLTGEHEITKELVEQYAAKHQVCPFEMALDVTLWSDCIICDYNYVFDPNVYLRRFFQQEKKMDYVFLVDEAHNLVERARQMYSARLIKEEFLRMKKIMQSISKKVVRCLELCNRDLLALKRQCENYVIVPEIESFTLHLLRLASEMDECLQERGEFEEREEVLNFYFDVRHFLNMYELLDEKYLIYTDYNEQDQFCLTLQCMDPSTNLGRCLEKGKSAVFFSATLLPIQYYKEQLAGTKEDYEIYVESPFQAEKRLVLIGNDVSTKYTRRNAAEYTKIACYIENFVQMKRGNYFVFFPSYQYMNRVLDCILEREYLKDMEIVSQSANMKEEEKESFLEEFVPNPTKTRIGFCVMGGIFSEGIDLKEDRLIGTVIVGTGLPMVCNEKEIFKQYYDDRDRNGFDYAYLYNGMNKVLQSAGRVIRTDEDRGVILLLDERFEYSSYQRLFPREWFPYVHINQNNLPQILKKFWEKEGE